MQPHDFYTRSRASNGVLLTLADPAGNAEWMRVRSVLSAEFVAMAHSVALLAESFSQSIPVLLVAEAKLARRKRRALLAASLVADWSLPMKTLDDIADLLIANPRLRRQIEIASESHALHFGVAA